MRAVVSSEARWGSKDAHLKGPDTVWVDNGAIDVGGSSGGYFECGGTGATNPQYTMSLYDAPSTPATYAGALTPGSSTSGIRNFENDLVFIAPGQAQYVADVGVSSGAISIDGRTVSSPTTQVDLGTLAAGEQRLGLSAMSGPQANWSVTIRALPVVMSAVKLALPVARSGRINTLTYTTSGETAVGVNILRDGVVRRTLATGHRVGLGEHSLTWDGRGARGEALADGAYTVTLDTVDPAGYTSHQEIPATIDSSPPAIAVVSRAVLKPHQALRVRVRDTGSGILSAGLRVGSLRAALQRGSSTIRLRPDPGYVWTAGRHSAVLTARDKAGNQVRRRLTFWVRSR